MADTKTVEVTVTFEGKEITLKGPSDFVRSEVERLVGFESRTQQSQAQPGAAKSVVPGAAENEREFIAAKQPRGHHEIVAVLGFFMAEHGQDEFTANDMRRAYIRAHERPPKYVSQALRDARNKWDFFEQGSKRGTFRLSPHGDRFVRFDLPRKEKA